MYLIFPCEPSAQLTDWVLRWPIDSASASHQCGPGSIPGWGPDLGAVNEKGFVPRPGLGGDVKPLT